MRSSILKRSPQGKTRGVCSRSRIRNEDLTIGPTPEGGRVRGLLDGDLICDAEEELCISLPLCIESWKQPAGGLCLILESHWFLASLLWRGRPALRRRRHGLRVALPGASAEAPRPSLLSMCRCVWPTELCSEDVGVEPLCGGKLGKLWDL